MARLPRMRRADAVHCACDALAAPLLVVPHRSHRVARGTWERTLLLRTADSMEPVGRHQRAEGTRSDDAVDDGAGVRRARIRGAARSARAGWLVSRQRGHVAVYRGRESTQIWRAL